MHRLVRALRCGALLLLLCVALPGLATPLAFRISTENSAAHFQTRVVQRFADELARRSKGGLQVEFRHSAQLFRDQDVLRAINEGKVEMAVPGNWQLDRYDPYVSLLMLPMFMGRSPTDQHRLRDGEVGQLIARHLAESLDVVVPGRWIDLGYANVFTTRKSIRTYQDLAGLRLRIAGGEAIAAQVRAVGATPMVVPWPDLPHVLRQERVDGLLSTYESVASASLWDMGIAHAVENKAYFAQYIPVISRTYWNSLPRALQSAIHESWESVVDSARAEAAQAQLAARRSLEAHGVRVLELSPAASRAWLARAVQDQTALASKLGIPEALLQQARQQLADAP